MVMPFLDDPIKVNNLGTGTDNFGTGTDKNSERNREPEPVPWNWNRNRRKFLEEPRTGTGTVELEPEPIKILRGTENRNRTGGTGTEEPGTEQPCHKVCKKHLNEQYFSKIKCFSRLNCTFAKVQQGAFFSSVFGRKFENFRFFDQNSKVLK